MRNTSGKWSRRIVCARPRNTCGCRTWGAPAPVPLEGVLDVVGHRAVVALDERDAVAGAREREGRAQPADAGADDDDVELVASTGARGRCAAGSPAGRRCPRRGAARPRRWRSSPGTRSRAGGSGGRRSAGRRESTAPAMVRLSKSITLTSAFLPAAEHAPIREPVHVGRGAGELVHRQLQRNPVALGAVPDPVGEVEGRAAAVGDHHHVRARVGQPAHACTDRAASPGTARACRRGSCCRAARRTRCRRPRSCGRRGSAAARRPSCRASAATDCDGSGS